ncbi:Major facilitator superfamily domain, general substrate transporter [Metarhizium guizhouense ARSEF 977]|uniref:Major facilitator superfamily domain, general substrate transporter n=1 Tax=Metarhizium guizhouense (strain ARSEF 977) TaxID=1276136 RepID=A0A0B4G559_METGA|nr:Major facilitator superfamily domain, general substrate transporter [Metarhizium guizhouense ARSEF 977]
MAASTNSAAAGTAAVCVPGRRPMQGQYVNVNGHITDDAPDINMLSRSLPTSGPVLEPEPADLAMLRPVTSNQSCTNRSDDHEGGVPNRDAPSERSPLLRPRASVSGLSTSSRLTESEPVLFLNGTSPSHFWYIYSQILMVHFIGYFDGTIMASSHPVITSYFGAANSASWLSTAFLLTSTAFQPLLGRLSDAVGRKPLFLGSLAIFGLATLWCALADSIEAFVVARAFCGLGAGGSMTVGSIITSDLVPIERRGAYQSYMNIIYGVGSALGAALGGAMAEALGWRWVFGIQIPPLVICLCVSAVAIPDDLGVMGERKTVMQAIREFDAKGSLLLTVAISFLILGLNLGGNVMLWSHPFVIASLTIFTVCFPAFIWIESRVSKPIMPPRLIQESPRSNLIFSNSIAALLSNAIFFNIPLYFQAVLLMSATDSGLRLVAPTLVSSFFGALTGFAMTWTRRLKWPLVCGAIAYLIGTICLFSLRRNLPSIAYFLTLLPSSIGSGFQFTGTFMATLASSPQSEQAVVSSTFILWRSLGMVLGIAVSSLLLQNALVFYLDDYVSGELKDSVIQRVRASVEAVAQLDEPYREQVIRAYETSLRLTFGFCILMAAVSVAFVMPMKLKRLPVRKYVKKNRVS